MLSLFNAAKSMSTWAKFTHEQAWPFVSEIKNNLREYHESHYAFYFLETKPEDAAQDTADRIRMATNVCLFLQSNKIRAVLNPRDNVILFPGYDRHAKDSKDQIIGLLNALEPKKHTMGLLDAVEEPKVGLAEVASGCSLRKLSKQS